MTGMIKVLSCGPGMTVQDLGRPGWQRHGLSQGGAMDRLAVTEGAVLLGEDPESAVIEMFQAGGAFEARGRALRFALTGAPMHANLDGVRIAWNASHCLRPGSRLEIGAAEAGTYGYLRLGGGVVTTPQLGARSTHLRSRIGGFKGRPLAAGDHLPIGTDSGDATGKRIEAVERIGLSTIRAIWGAQAHMFDEPERERFLETRFRVGPRMDRMGVCLTTDDRPIRAESHLSGISDAVACGDIQVPGDGRPVVLLADRPSTGGYPRIATVITADLPRMAQAAAGQTISFTIVPLSAAVAALGRQAEEMADLAGRVHPLYRDPETIPDLMTRQLIGGMLADEHLPWKEGP